MPSSIHRPLLALLLVAGCAPLWAHAVLQASTPAAGASLAASPAELRLSFNEALETGFSQVRLHDAGGTAVTTGELHAADGTAHTLVVPLKGPIAAGRYVVQWSAMGHDGHRTKGEFAFSVK
jgi:methionine-rich copper-binding protein CopC